MVPGLSTGRIIWAEIADANGIRKLRPAVILTPTDQITSAVPFDVAAVTSRIPTPLPDDHVLLPWHAAGHARTGLNRKCAAVCTWVAQIVDSDVQSVAGIVPSSVMATILTKVAAALPPPPGTTGGSPPSSPSTGLPSLPGP